MFDSNAVNSNERAGGDQIAFQTMVDRYGKQVAFSILEELEKVSGYVDKGQLDEAARWNRVIKGYSLSIAE